MTKIREWLSIELIGLGLNLIPYEDVRYDMKMAFVKVVDNYLDE